MQHARDVHGLSLVRRRSTMAAMLGIRRPARLSKSFQGDLSLTRPGPSRSGNALMLPESSLKAPGAARGTTSLEIQSSRQAHEDH